MNEEIQHVIPINDIRDHTESVVCWCKPEFKDGVYMHNSMDRREEYERGEREPN